MKQEYGKKGKGWSRLDNMRMEYDRNIAKMNILV